MAIGNREVTDLPLLSAINGSDLYAVKSDQDYRVKVGGPNGLAYLDTTGRLASEFLQPNLATFDPNSKLDVANYNWNTLPNKPTYFPTDWSNVASKPAFHAVATSGNYNDLNNKPTTMAPTAHTHAAGDITSGVMAAARLGSGSPTTSTFLRGDGTWATVPDTASIDWTNITNKPATFTPSAHTHAATDVTSGVFGVARIPDLAQSKVTGLAAALGDKVNKAGDTVTGQLTMTSGATVKILDASGAQANLELGAGYASSTDHHGFIANRWGDGFIELLAAAGAHRLRVGPGGLQYNDQPVWHAGNFNPATKLDYRGELDSTAAFPPGNDWNNALSNGWWMGAGYTNAPDGSGEWFIGQVVVHNTLWVTQTLWRFTNNHRITYQRQKSLGTWGAWERLYMHKDTLDTEYLHNTRSYNNCWSATDSTDAANARNETGFDYATLTNQAGPLLAFGGAFGDKQYPGAISLAFETGVLKYRARNGDNGTWGPIRTAWDDGNFDPTTKATVNNPSFTGAITFAGVTLENNSGLYVNGTLRLKGVADYQLAANSASWVRLPRTFVQSSDPGAAAADGDLWFW